MNKILWIFFLLVVLSSCKKSLKEDLPGETKRDIMIIPRPMKISILNGTFKLNEKTSVKTDQDLILMGDRLRNYLSPATGYLLPINKKRAGGNLIELKIKDELSSLGEEGYRISIKSRKVLITAYTSKGIFWGIQTLRQLFPDEILRKAVVENVEWILPCVNITDKPRFKWRGWMIDYSRTY